MGLPLLTRIMTGTKEKVFFISPGQLDNLEVRILGFRTARGSGFQGGGMGFWGLPVTQFTYNLVVVTP